MDADTLRRYLEFYRDLGIKSLYRRSAAGGAGDRAGHPLPLRVGTGDQVPGGAPAAVAGRGLGPGIGDEAGHPLPLRVGAGDQAGHPLPLRVEAGQPASESLFQILEDIGDCRRCRLHERRTKIVFGVGNERAPLVFVGEGPGADEDVQGIPFVGRAGQLLTQMIENTAKKEGIPLRREDVYICNVVKCRPPENRTPEPDEMEICGQFLNRQLAAIHPKAICVLGGTAVRALLGQKEGVTRLRGRWFRWRDVPVMVTYHPSYLLRGNQEAKREAWEDLKKVLHFVYD